MINQLIVCDVYWMEAADPYPDSPDATVDRDVGVRAKPCALRTRTAHSSKFPVTTTPEER
jgi:hypothetical protein